MSHRPIRPAQVFTLGEYLLDELEARGWSTERLARESGLPLEDVEELVYDRHRPDDAEFAGLAKAFGTSEELFRNLDSMPWW
jgi:HTH-type transcriptional regulator/antitoxin HigA